MSESSRIRAAAARTLSAILGGRSLDAAMSRFEPPVEQVALYKALVYHSVRWQPRLSRLAGLLLDRPLRARDRVIDALLQVGLCQLSVMNAADHAAVSETVNAARDLGKPGLAGLVNGVLRKYLRVRDTLEAELDRDPVAASAHPGWMLDVLREDWPERWREIVDGGNLQAPMWLRVNRTRISARDYLQELNDRGHEATLSAWVDDGIRLDKACAVEELPGFGQGRVSVQDGASQLASQLLAPVAGQRVLDACAAPGGKTGHLLELAGGDIDLLALDRDSQRLRKVDETLERLGWTAATRTADAASPGDWWDGKPFQRILLDTPCSGSGVIRRHPDIKLLRRRSDIDDLAGRQKALLDGLWPTLDRGGLMLYCSCSVYRQENQQQIDRFVNSHSDAELLPLSDRLRGRFGDGRGPGFQVFPGEEEMDGFFYAVLRKSSVAKD
ncbi:MAG: 16S rRNA (cytosine(967)-C(5))-methyltransferase RsmB [Gammaproteobacteria bacterium]|nr:16S rRNA (cytosine(967)-C(5))-methyltransferase RsmB [Gammaproteobacteria bacterium]